MATKNEIIYDLTKNILAECKENSIDIRLFGSVALLFLDSSRIEFINQYRKGIADIDIIKKLELVENIDYKYSLSTKREYQRE